MDRCPKGISSLFQIWLQIQTNHEYRQWLFFSGSEMHKSEDLRDRCGQDNNQVRFVGAIEGTLKRRNLHRQFLKSPQRGKNKRSIWKSASCLLSHGTCWRWRSLSIPKNLRDHWVTMLKGEVPTHLTTLTLRISWHHPPRYKAQQYSYWNKRQNQGNNKYQISRFWSE